MKMKRLKDVARESGENYQNLRTWTLRFEKDLTKEGLLKVERTLAGRRRFLVLTDTETFISVLKDLIGRYLNEGKTSARGEISQRTC